MTSPVQDARTLQPDLVPAESVTPYAVPAFLQSCPAGFPSPAADYVESGLDLNEYLIRHRAATFIFTVSGDSMRGVGIFNGDKIVVDRAVEPRHGLIVVALLHGEHTVKRLYCAEGRVELHAANPKYPPICLSDMEELQVFGVVVGIVRRLSV